MSKRGILYVGLGWLVCAGFIWFVLSAPDYGWIIIVCLWVTVMTMLLYKIGKIIDEQS